MTLVSPIVITWIATLLATMSFTAIASMYYWQWSEEALDHMLAWAVEDRIAEARSEQAEWTRLLKLAKLKEAARVTIREFRAASAERKAEKFRASVVLPGLVASLDLPAPNVSLVTDWAVLQDMGLLPAAAELQRVVR